MMIFLFQMASFKPISWQEVKSGSISGVFEEKAVWYDTTYSNLIEDTPESVVLLFLGRRPSGGFGIKVEEVKTNGKKIVIKAKEICPDPSSPVVTVITSPFVAIKLEFKDRLPLELRLERCR